MAQINPHINFNGNAEEALKLFNGLSVGGQVVVPIEESPLGSYFGMFRDKYDIEWMVDFNPKQISTSPKCGAMRHSNLL